MDEGIADHILTTHQNLPVEGEISKGIVEVGGEKIAITPELIHKYIYYAESITAVLTDEAKGVLKEAYVSLRKTTREAAEPITARKVESMIRLAEALAKAKLKTKVEKEEAEEAVNILMECYNEIAKDPETGLLDFAKIGGVPKSESNKLDLVRDAIKHLEERDNSPADFYDLEELLSKKSISEEQLENYLTKLKMFGDIMEVRSGKYKVVS